MADAAEGGNRRAAQDSCTTGMQPLSKAESTVKIDRTAVMTGRTQASTMAPETRPAKAAAPRADPGIAPRRAVPAGMAGRALAQVNHYCVRSPDVFAMKSRRGRGAVAESWPNRAVCATPMRFTTR